jgi:homoserine kinase
VGRNSAGPPAIALLKRARIKKGFVITIDKSVPQGLGLGSSGATAAASAKALDHLLSLDLSDDELVRVASLGEKAVTGTAHADNVGASLLGGFVVVYDDPVKAISIKPLSDLTIVVATPHVTSQRNKTRKARALVPNKIETRQAVLNIGRASAIAAGFAKGNIPMIGTGMEDEIAEPYRRILIPGYSDVRRLALEAGAVGVSISGAGPSLVALVDRSRREPRTIAKAMIRGFAQNNVRSTCFVTRPAPGARIIEGV